jgi:hypothetical protein
LEYSLGYIVRPQWNLFLCVQLRVKLMKWCILCFRFKEGCRRLIAPGIRMLRLLCASLTCSDTCTNQVRTHLRCKNPFKKHQLVLPAR